MRKVKIVKVIDCPHKVYYEQFIGKEFDRVNCCEMPDGKKWFLPVPSHKLNDEGTFWESEELEFID